MSIETIEEQIVVVAKGVVDLKAVYDYPVFELGRDLPALMVLYDGMTQGPGPDRHTETHYNFDFTLYFPIEGRNLKQNWLDVKKLVPKVLNVFRGNPGLNGTVWWSLITAGQPIIDIPADPKAKPKWMGHSFTLTTRKEEN